ncbi:hypothetical protein [Thioalkalivibrio sp. HK1]|uniref:hypothetical protein n=1 Tax=Thioalkalivibrio sp. HK1 TaxID=1469245 RepID=UPI0004BA341E|nr:hypothetical protein [Thioalkalivibrio sp. HK1]
MRLPQAGLPWISAQKKNVPHEQDRINTAYEANLSDIMIPTNKMHCTIDFRTVWQQ